jgi:mRNA interferase MazF
MVNVNRGELVLVDLNPVVGTEQSGIRPAVIVQVNKANKTSPHTIIVPLTSKIRNVILPSHVFLASGTCGLAQDSVALCEQIRVVDKQRVIKIMGSLPYEKINEINKALSTILAI